MYGSCEAGLNKHREHIITQSIETQKHKNKKIRKNKKTQENAD